jgi:hypothetical protein
MIDMHELSIDVPYREIKHLPTNRMIPDKFLG